MALFNRDNDSDSEWKVISTKQYNKRKKSGEIN